MVNRGTLDGPPAGCRNVIHFVCFNYFGPRYKVESILIAIRNNNNEPESQLHHQKIVYRAGICCFQHASGQSRTAVTT